MLFFLHVWVIAIEVKMERNKLTIFDCTSIVLYDPFKFVDANAYDALLINDYDGDKFKHLKHTFIYRNGPGRAGPTWPI